MVKTGYRPVAYRKSHKRPANRGRRGGIPETEPDAPRAGSCQRDALRRDVHNVNRAVHKLNGAIVPAAGTGCQAGLDIICSARAQSLSSSMLWPNGGAIAYAATRSPYKLGSSAASSAALNR